MTERSSVVRGPWFVVWAATGLASLIVALGMTPVAGAAANLATDHGPRTTDALKPNVIFITIDTLRADHLGCYGYKQIQTPSIDALARAGVRFTQAYTPVPITLPAHTTIFTGSYPVATGMHDFSGNKLAANIPTLATVLRDHGYTTAAFIGAAVLDARFGLNQGFDTYDAPFDFSRLDESSLDLMERRGDVVMNAALKWLAGAAGSSSTPPGAARPPFFLWVHLYDPHYPYTPPEPYASRYRAHPYDGEIAFADSQVARLVAYLKQHGLYDASLIVLSADHGEGLGEHGEKTHGFFVYNSTLHVPLILKLPPSAEGAAAGPAGPAGRVVTAEVSLADVMPTVLQTLKLPIPPSVQGRSLLSQALGRTAGGASVLYSETYLPLLHFGWSPLRGFQSRGEKYIDAPRPELYDTHADPRESKNLYPSRRSLGHEMHDRLYSSVRRFTPASGNATIGREGAKEATDPALLERLRSLGYVAISSGAYTEASGKPLADPKDRIQVYELVSEAMSDGQHGRYQQSLSKLRQAGKTEPASFAIRYLAALDEYHLKDFARAASSFKSALELDPKSSLALYYLGLTQLEGGDQDGAMASFEHSLEIDPTNFVAAFDLGAAYLKRNRIDDAVREFERAVRINPSYARAYEALGEVYLYQKRNDDAIRSLERAVQLAPGSSKAHYNLGRAYQAAGRVADAEREFGAAKSP